MFTKNYANGDCLPPTLDVLIFHMCRAKHKLAFVIVLSFPTLIENGWVIKT